MPTYGLCPSTKKQAGMMHGPYTLRRVETTKGARLILSGYSPHCVNKKTGQEVKITKIVSGDAFGAMRPCAPGSTRHLVTKRCVHGSGVSQDYLERMVAGKSADFKAALRKGNRTYAKKYVTPKKTSKSRRTSKSSSKASTGVLSMLGM